MFERRIQFTLWTVHVAIACVAIALGVALGGPARALVVVTTGVFALVMLAGVTWLGGVFLLEGAAAAWQWARWAARLPFMARQALFSRRMARLRLGNPAQRVRRVLGTPWRVDGFGDRLYWSYRVGGQRYMVSLDPRRVAAKYSNGLSRDVVAKRA